jgi:hypothetical protein
MSAGWVAPAVRGRALVQRLIGVEGARTLAESSSWPEARDRLGATIYGKDLPAGCDRATARRAAATSTTWQLRVLAGWLPANQAGLARVFAGPMEIANIEGRVASFEGAPAEAPIDLGSMAVAWPRVAAAASPSDVRSAIARSSWGDPGGSSLIDVAVGLRVSWLRRLTVGVPESANWARGAAALIAARERFALRRRIAPTVEREIDRMIGPGWHRTDDLATVRDRLPSSASWVLQDVTSRADFWRAELRALERAAADSRQLLDSGRYTRGTTVGAMGLLLVDLWRVSAAIELAGRHPGELLDALA